MLEFIKTFTETIMMLTPESRLDFETGFKDCTVGEIDHIRKETDVVYAYGVECGYHYGVMDEFILELNL